MRNLDNSKQAGSGTPPPGAMGEAGTEAVVSPPTDPVGPRANARRPAGNRDGVVLFSIAAVSVALTTMFATQMAMPLATASLYGAVTWTAFMLVHKLVQKSAQVTQLKAELARARGQGQRSRSAVRPAPSSALETAAATTIDTRAPDMSSAVPHGDGLRTPPVAAAPVSDFRLPQWQPTAGGLGTPPTSEAVPPHGSGRRHRIEMPPLLGAEPDTAPPPAPTEPMSGLPAAAAVPSPPLFTLPEPQPVVQVEPSADPLRDQWSFRPRPDSRVAPGEGSIQAGLQAADKAASLTIEGDLDLVQRKIRELAEEVNAADTLRSGPTLRVDPPARSKADALEDSIGALKIAATTMRDRGLSDYIPALDLGTATRPAESSPGSPSSAIKALGDLVIPSTAKRIAGSDDRTPEITASAGRREPDLPFGDFPLGPPLASSPPMNALPAQAINVDAMTVTLAPIVTLATHSVGHYEMAARLKSSHGEPIQSEQDIAALEADTAARFDIVRLNRATALALRMETRDKDGSLLTAFLGTSFSSRPFLEAVAGAYEARARIAAQLVPVLSQRSIDAFTPAAWQALRDMHAFGFRFALDGVTDVAADFAGLALAGFRFVRLDARVLLEGTAAADRFVSSDEIRQRVALAGLIVIADGVNDARVQTGLLEAGIELGQGSLFGSARQVNLQGSSNAERSAA